MRVYICVWVCVYLCGINKVSERVYYNFPKPKPNVFLLTICCVWRMFDSSSSLCLFWQTNVTCLVAPNGKQKPFRNSLFRYSIYACNANFSVFVFFSMPFRLSEIHLHHTWCVYNCSISSTVLTFLCCQNNLRIQVHWGMEFSVHSTAQHSTLAYVLLCLSQH